MARIAIVGAGPSGASAGWHLATRGHDVTLIDRAEFPRPKTCGDWITLGSVSELSRLGLPRDEIERRTTERVQITRTVIVSPIGRRTSAEQSEHAYCIPRLVFDDLLWRHAVAAGCRPLRRSVRDIAAAPDLRDQFDHIVDARGAHAGDANAVALRAYWTIPRALVGDDAAAVQIHTDAQYRRGYGWMFPVHIEGDEVRMNLGVGLWKADSVSGRSVADFYERFTTRNPTVLRWRSAARMTRPVGCHVGLGLWRHEVARDGVLRIGDAANVADPLTGDGIGNALLSGRLVAEVIDSTPTSEVAAAWQQRHDSAIAPELRCALAIRQALVASSAKNFAARVLSASPWLRHRVHAAFFGETPYRTLMLGGSRMSHL